MKEKDVVVSCSFRTAHAYTDCHFYFGLLILNYYVDRNVNSKLTSCPCLLFIISGFGDTLTAPKRPKLYLVKKICGIT